MQQRWCPGRRCGVLVRRSDSTIRTGALSKDVSMPFRMSVLLLAVVLALSCLPGCSNALNPLCASARPAPLIGSLSPSRMDFAQVMHGAVLTVNGSHFVSSTVVVINGTTLATTVVNSNQLKVTITTGLIPAPGAFNVTVNTPSGNTGDLGCSSGGTSGALVLTIT
jgi:IPT/TIG domain